MAGGEVYFEKLRPPEVDECLIRGATMIKWDDDSTLGQKCVVKVDPAGHIIYWKAEDKLDTDLLELTYVRDVRTAKWARIPKFVNADENYNNDNNNNDFDDSSNSILFILFAIKKPIDYQARGNWLVRPYLQLNLRVKSCLVLHGIRSCSQSRLCFRYKFKNDFKIKKEMD
ncbi:predicted protein [Nematostella vectensis]|uniref:PLC-beta PH domain-containing protein n=1 Tax=Nematostella vectensis TaxID=45351 RepID=A7RXP5_NEMVE|nr:predicted protein [Nematostella vectensis]|eukprot:XP_001635875.1 predicted protein [Nematostella vectensis]